MRIRTYGGTTSQRSIARDAAKFVLSDALPVSSRKLANTTVYIRFVDEAEADYYGCAYAPAENSYVAKSYTVKINLAEAKTEKEFLETLMHELVHVSQMANRTVLRYTYDRSEEKYYAFWRGTKHDPDKGYSKQPWERQAFYWEKRLVKMFEAR